MAGLSPSPADDPWAPVDDPWAQAAPGPGDDPWAPVEDPWAAQETAPPAPAAPEQPQSMLDMVGNAMRQTGKAFQAVGKATGISDMRWGDIGPEIVNQTLTRLKLGGQAIKQAGIDTLSDATDVAVGTLSKMNPDEKALYQWVKDQANRQIIKPAMDKVQGQTAEIVDRSAQFSQQFMPDQNFAERSVVGGASSVAAVAPLLGVAALTRNPNVVLVPMSGLTGAETYATERAQGETQGDSAVNAALQGMIEYWTERLPTMALLDVKSSAGRAVLDFIWKDLVGEQFATAGQNAVDQLVGEIQQPMTVKDFLQAQADTLGATLVAGPLQAAGPYALARGRQLAEERKKEARAKLPIKVPPPPKVDPAPDSGATPDPWAPVGGGQPALDGELQPRLKQPPQDPISRELNERARRNRPALEAQPDTDPVQRYLTGEVSLDDALDVLRLGVDQPEGGSSSEPPAAAPASPDAAIIETLSGQEGTEVRIAKNPKGFAVSLKDLDSGETVPSITIFPTLERAREYARKVAGPQDVPRETAPTPKPEAQAVSTEKPQVKPQESAGTFVPDEDTAEPVTIPAEAPTAAVDRLAVEPELRATVERLARSAGWAEQGGRVIRGSEDFNDPAYNEIRRSKWVPQADWWLDPERPEGTAADYRKAVAAALAGGTRLGAKQRRIIDYLVTAADRSRELAQQFEPFTPPEVYEGQNPKSDPNDNVFEDVEPYTGATASGQIERAGRVRESQDDLFGAAPGRQATGQRQQDVKRRQAELDERLASGRDVPEWAERKGSATRDLFSRQPELMPDTPKARTAREPVILTRLPAAKPSQPPQEFGGKMAARPRPRMSEVRSGLQTVKSLEDAAHVLAPIRRLNQEEFLMLAVNRDGRPVAILSHTKGGMYESSVYWLEMLGQIALTNQAEVAAGRPPIADVYLAHMHPSGNPNPSEADEKVTTYAARMLPHLGLRFGGHLVFPQATGRTVTYMEPDGSLRTGGPKAANRFRSSAIRVPITEVAATTTRLRGMDKLSSPQTLTRYVDRHLQGRRGVLLTDGQNQPRMFVPVTEKEMMRLKEHGAFGIARVGDILSAAVQAGATRAHVLIQDESAASYTGATNVENALRVLSGGRLNVADYVLTRPGKQAATLAGRADVEKLRAQSVTSTFFSNPFGPMLRAVNDLFDSVAARTTGRVYDLLAEKLAFMTPLKDLPQQSLYRQKRGLTGGKLEVIDELSRKVYDTFKDLNAADSMAVYTYLTTKGAPLPAVDRKVAQTAQAVKQTFDVLGQQMVRLGLISQEAFDKYQDSYLPRLYLRHVLEMGGFGTGMRTSDLGQTKRRKEIDPAVRELILGEIKDPAFLAAFGMTRTARDVSILELLNDIATVTDWVPSGQLINFNGRTYSPVAALQEVAILRRNADHTEDTAAQATMRQMAKSLEALAEQALGNSPADRSKYKQVPDSPRYGLLRGLWVRSEIYDDLIGGIGFVPAEASDLQRFFSASGMGGQVTRWFKWGKVAAYPPAQFRNIMGNVLLLYLSGVPIRKIWSLGIKTIVDWKKHGPISQAMEEYGVFRSTFSAQEMQRVEREWLDFRKRLAAGQGVARASAWELADMMATIVNKTSDAYQWFEAIGKGIKIQHELEKGTPLAEAVQEAQTWLFDYSEVPAWLRYSRNAPIGTPFLTWTYKVAPRLAEVALKHPQRFIPFIVLPHVLSAMMQAAFDIDDDDIEKLQEALPNWLREKGGAMFLPWRDSNGRWQALDVGYILPWYNFELVGKELMRGNPGEALAQISIAQGPGRTIIDALSNHDSFRDQPIYRPEDAPATRYGKLVAHLWNGIAPGMVTSSSFIFRSLEPTGLVVPDSVREPITAGQAAVRPFGLNVYPINPQEQRQRNLGQYRAQLAEIDRRWRSKVRRAPEEKREGFRQDWLEERARFIREMQEYAVRSEPTPAIVNPKRRSERPEA